MHMNWSSFVTDAFVQIHSAISFGDKFQLLQIMCCQDSRILLKLYRCKGNKIGCHLADVLIPL